MMKYRLFLLAVFLALPLAHAVKVDGPTEAEDRATHIFTGKIAAIYSRAFEAPPYHIVANVALVEIESIQKGDGLQPGQVVYVRYESVRSWSSKGTPSPGPGPHLNVPSEGQRRKVCVTKNADGTFDVYYVSGFKNP